MKRLQFGGEVMAITTEQRVQVAKDRALDELQVVTGLGYLHMDAQHKIRLQALAGLLYIDDSHPCAYDMANSLNLINGEEYLYFEGK